VTAPAPKVVPLRTIAREWGRLGVIGFGGPPAHISLLRRLCVDEREWLTAHDFEDAIAATNLLPGPASTQLAIFCAWRLHGRLGALVGGVCFIVPGLVMILVLSTLFLGSDPPLWVLGAAAGAGAAVPAIAVSAAVGLMPPSWKRVGTQRSAQVRWMLYLAAGGLAAATVGAFLVFIIAVCGIAEIVARVRPSWDADKSARAAMLAGAPGGVVTGGMAALAWVALKVGALSYGGGFVIIQLMQHDAVDTYHWMTGSQFLNAVALGQVTPGPVVLTVAAVGYAAGGIISGLLAAAIAFGPSFLFVMIGGPHFDRLRHSLRTQAFLTGAGAAAIGAIAGAAVPLARSLGQPWQLPVLAAAAAWVLALRRGVVPALVIAGVIGAVAVAAGAPMPA
jgi:chromate transporter